MIIALLGLALAAGPLDGAAADQAMAQADAGAVPTFSGAFDAPPVAHFRVRLPGGRSRSGTHSERGRAVVYGDMVLVGSSTGSALYGLSRRDGSLIKTWPASGPVQSAAVVTGHSVTFSDTAGVTWSYDLDGTLRWQHRGASPILVAPTVRDGFVLVADVKDLLVALDADTGELIWRHQHPVDAGRAGDLALYASPAPSIDQGRVLAGFSDGMVVVLGAETGDELWRVPVGEGNYPDLVAGVVAEGSDVFASGYFSPFVAIDSHTQNVRWRLERGSAATPLIDLRGPEPVLYHPGTSGTLAAVNARTGDQLWTWGDGDGGALTQPVATEAGLLFGATEGGLYLVAPEDGHEIWRYRGETLLNGVSQAPVVAGRQLLAVTNGGYLLSLVVPESVQRPEATRPFAGGLWAERGPMDRP